MPAKSSARETATIAFVSRDEDIRLRAARAFDAAPAHWMVELHDVAPSEADVVVHGRDVAEAGGIVFDELSPHRTLDEVAARLQRRSSDAIVVVTGAGRGLGVTSVALHLAQALAVTARTCLVDLDDPPGIRPRLGLDSVVPGEVGPERLATVPVAGRFRVAFAPESDEAVPPLLEGAAGGFDRVVIDVPWGARRDAVLREARLVVLVVGATPTALGRARSILERFPDPAWAVVVNRLGAGGELTQRAVEATLGRRVAVELPVCAALRDAEDEGALLASRWHRWRRRVGRLAVALEGWM